MTMSSLPSDVFAKRLRQERERRRMSQAQLADGIADLLGTNIDPTAVTRIEKQERAVRLDEAVAAAEALGLPLSALLGDDLVHANEYRIQVALLELGTAQRRWEEQRQETLRLMRIIETLTGENSRGMPGSPQPEQTEQDGPGPLPQPTPSRVTDQDE